MINKKMVIIILISLMFISLSITAFFLAQGSKEDGKIIIKKSKYESVNYKIDGKEVSAYITSEDILFEGPPYTVSIRPGKHKVEATANRYLPFSTEFTLQPGETKEIETILTQNINFNEAEKD